MSKRKKISMWAAAVLLVIGALLLLGSQYVMKATSSTEFCVSCHSMEYPAEEWKASGHFSNTKGIRAECADCHIPHDGIDYVKAKVIALKDVWFTLTNKIPDRATFEEQRGELAQRVWDEMKANDSATCRSCHNEDAMIVSEQSDSAQKMHKLAKETNQTCIDCHKGLVHFMPETHAVASVQENVPPQAVQIVDNQPLYASNVSTATLIDGGEARLLPYAELANWKEEDNNFIGTIEGWQQTGAESLIYKELGKRINVAVLNEEAKTHVNVVNTVHDEVTDSDWKKVNINVSVPKSAVTSNLESLNQYGHNLNQTHCSGCHAAIGADHYTANQWIGVVNSMKDRTSMTANEVRALTIYLQRHAKDMH
ncbi:NapC/NirT family cytochrome c [[Mannheimia] succiniciproducens]|uniref:Cytochrome c-type protein n=1 Tax=Mannheimia succiniciproducens (strain KCTC 0769BP / MBEL55E) TaxID=221988 RepID=Q65V16_MANSM|nr:NapC/NirT family cytochrome c [[Mannheimia] succiniciproducens]AAU37194.1 TorC protein [[Mannheimia] succiniciproducens MBEL55E]